LRPLQARFAIFASLANFAFCQNHARYSFWWFLLLPFAPAKNSHPFGFLHILPLFRVQQIEIQVSQGKALQIIVKGALLNHKNGEKRFPERKL